MVGRIALDWKSSVRRPDCGGAASARPAPCGSRGMCAVRKQSLSAALWAAALCQLGAFPALASDRSAGGIALGESHGGITDQAYVIAPPHWLYVVEKEPGSFLDCGEGQETRSTDASGRDVAALTCGVTLTETVVIPAASTSARIIVHY